MLPSKYPVSKTSCLIAMIFADASFKFLYDKNRDLLCIGYNLSDRKLDNNHYDLLASEARLSAYYAIAKGDIPPIILGEAEPSCINR
jgi:hypothetical protein